MRDVSGLYLALWASVTLALLTWLGPLSLTPVQMIAPVLAGLILSIVALVIALVVSFIVAIVKSVGKK